MQIIIADPLPVIRSGLKQALLPLARSVKFVEADDLQALRQAAAANPGADLAVVDAALPGSGGVHDLCQLAGQSPLRLVLALAGEDTAFAVCALSGGAAGVILKTSLAPVILAALQVVLAGGRYVAPELFLNTTHPPNCIACASGFLDTRATFGTRAKASDLTPRQRQVMDLMVEGLSNKEIGRRLHLTEGTVKVHVARILETLDVSSRMKAVAKARLIATKAGREHK